MSTSSCIESYIFEYSCCCLLNSDSLCVYLIVSWCSAKLVVSVVQELPHLTFYIDLATISTFEVIERTSETWMTMRNGEGLWSV